MGNVLIREIELPLTVEGVTVKDTEGNYNIYINIFLLIISNFRITIDLLLNLWYI